MKKLLLPFIVMFLLTCNIDETLRNNPLDDASSNYAVPTAEFTINGGLSANIYSPAIFDAGNSENPKDSILLYRWDYTNDGNWDTTFSQSMTITHHYTAVGNYNCKLEVQNEEGYSDVIIKNFDVGESQLPTAAFTYSPSSPRRNGTVTFDASTSTDDDTSNSGLQVRWDFENDGTFDVDWTTEKRTTHIYTLPGSVTAKLEVKDQYGLVDSTTQSFTVAESKAPVASFTYSPSIPIVREEVTFDASGSADDDTSLSALEVRWDFENDGTFDTSWATIKTATHTYETAGEYTVNLEVRDSYGIVGSTNNSFEVVTTLPPIVNNSTDVIIESLTIKTDDGNNDLKANKGETIEFALAVKNNKTTSIEGVNVSLTSTSPYVSILTDTDSGYYTIKNNQIDYGTNPGFKIKILTTATPNTKIYFDVVISSTSGNWTSRFYINVYGVSSNVVYSSYSNEYEVSGNSDKIINPGETIKLKIKLTNNGTESALNCNAVISSTSNKVSITDNTDSYGTITVGGVAEGTGDGYEALFSSSLINNEVVTFNIVISDDKGNSWNDTFDIIITDDPRGLVITAFNIGAEPVGNGNLQVNPGETIALYVTIQNQGATTISNVTGVLSSSNDGITVNDNTDSYGNINASAIDNGTSSIPFGYRFSVDTSVESGTSIIFSLRLTDTNSHIWNDSFTINVQ